MKALSARRDAGVLLTKRWRTEVRKLTIAKSLSGHLLTFRLEG